MITQKRQFRVSEAAALLGVSDDTVRRWGEAGRLEIDHNKRRAGVDGRTLAALAQELAAESQLPVEFPQAKTSARNRITGIVTRVTVDGLSWPRSNCRPARSASSA